MPPCNDEPDIIVGRDADRHHYCGIEARPMTGCIPPNTNLTYDPAAPDDDPVMYVTEFGGRVYVFHQNSTWRSAKLPWPRRLWRWVTGLRWHWRNWRGNRRRGQ